MADALRSLIKLEKLDVSNNFFRLQGCQHLGDALRSHEKLEQLLVAGNAGGFASSTGINPAGLHTKNVQPESSTGHTCR